ncbi:MAG: hypothetical protein GF344_17610 [Chitinivibrionales bacterium]|nr:hypothetical protein [Chitinivibrionales bacterium]MBD3358485.1 hypothetical protein [Chitinivibrionales bacterium]
MPGGNGMGPMGMGPMTGRGAGYCSGYGVPGYVNTQARGRGMGRGRGWGHGFGMGMAWRRGWAPPAYAPDAYPPPYASGIPPRNEAEALKSQAKYIQEALEDINKRIAEIEGDNT